MERFINYGCVVLAILSISLSVNIHAQPTTQSVSGPDSKLPPLLFPIENVTGLPPLIFPKENATVGTGPQPHVFPVENATVVTLPPLLLPKTNFTGKLADMPPLIFPKTNGTIPVVELPPLLFPSDNKKFFSTNETALNILNAKSRKPVRNPSNEDYYDEMSSEQVEEVQAVDKNRQNDNLEENYKSKATSFSTDQLNDNTEVDHPMLKNSHVLGVMAAILAALCACIYIGLIIWRRIIFNRYGMRERLIDEDDFYSNKNISRHF